MLSHHGAEDGILVNSVCPEKTSFIETSQSDSRRKDPSATHVTPRSATTAQSSRVRA
jgi:NAD(P)-dependent dehydrogenase (short-subunit alcohol dehydrogenase family)